MAPSPVPASRVFVDHVMGTVVSLHVRDGGPAPTAAVESRGSAEIPEVQEHDGPGRAGTSG